MTPTICYSLFRLSCFVLLFLLLWSPSLRSQSDVDPTPLVLEAVRIDRPLNLTGKMDDALWSRATPVTLDYEIEPGDNAPAPQKTEVSVLYNHETLYIGFRCFDSNPSEIRANLSDRDKIFSDDFVVAVIDTYADSQRGYEIVVNPYGIQGDLLWTQNGEDMSYNMIWQSAAAVNGEGWTAEMAIPFKSLQFPPDEEQEWHITFFRNIPRASRTQVTWLPIDRNLPSVLTQMGRLTGLKDIQAVNTFEVLPYAIAQQAGALANSSDPASAFRNDPIYSRIGGGFKYAPGRDLTFEAVLNPDFSQVESDADQISVNTNFALHYPERRPFFLEGGELLQTPMYYSRSINDPLGAGRVIGKTGGLSYMYLGAYDRNTPILVPGEESSNTVRTSLGAFANIARARYDIENQTYLGGMVFTRDLDGGHNYLVGFDWNYRFWSNWDFGGEGFITQTKELNDTLLFSSSRRFGDTGHTASFDGEKYTGHALHMVISHADREFPSFIEVNTISPTFQSYNGLFGGVDFRQIYFNQQYRLYPENSFFTRVQFWFDANGMWNQRGVFKSLTVEPGVWLQMKGQITANASYQLVNDEMYAGIQFRNLQKGHVSIQARPIDAFSVEYDAQFGDFIYRSASVVGTGHDMGASITVRPTSQLKFDISYNRSRLSDKATGVLFYDGYVMRGVGVYQFTREMFLRMITQYNSFDRSVSLYPLVSYKLNPLTTFYAGMTNDQTDFTPGPGFTTTTRQYFVKLQYLFRS